MGLNCVDPLTCRFFSINAYYNTTQSQLVEPADMELQIWRAVDKVICGFLTAWVLVSIIPTLFKGQPVQRDLKISISHKGKDNQQTPTPRYWN